MKLLLGVYANGRLRCPNHGACFNVETGDIEDYPGLDSLPKFGVRRFIFKKTNKILNSKIYEKN